MLRLDLYQTIARDRQEQVLEHLRVTTLLRNSASSSPSAPASEKAREEKPKLEPEPACS